MMDRHHPRQTPHLKARHLLPTAQQEPAMMYHQTATAVRNRNSGANAAKVG